jgi:hypothetical protein
MPSICSNGAKLPLYLIFKKDNDRIIKNNFPETCIVRHNKKGKFFK